MWTLEEPVGRFDSKLSECISVCAWFIFPEQTLRESGVWIGNLGQVQWDLFVAD